MRVENVFSLIFVSIGNAVSPYISQNLGAKKIDRLKKGYHAALVLDLCFAVIAFAVIETLHTQISSLFLGKDGTALAYQVSGDYMRWLGYFFIFMGIKMATDGVLRGLGIMRPFLIANMVNLAIRLSVALLCRPGRVACKLSGLLCGAQKIVADGKCSGTSMILCSAAAFFLRPPRLITAVYFWQRKCYDIHRKSKEELRWALQGTNGAFRWARYPKVHGIRSAMCRG